MNKLAGSNMAAFINGGLRSIAASFPVAGSLAQAWAEYEAHIKSKRLSAFFQDLSEVVAGMQSELDKVREHIRQSEEFPALLEKTLESVQREVSTWKRRCYAQALMNQVASGSSRSYDEKLNILDALETLTESDLVLLSLFEEERTLFMEQVLAIQIRNGCVVARERELGKIVVSFSKLEARGLITETKTFDPTINHLGPEPNGLTKWQAKAFEILPFGEMLLDSLKQKIPQSPRPEFER